MEAFIKGIPKAELHIHIEGSLEPELMLELAAKNRIDLPFHSVSDIRNAYNFKDLQSFLDIYYQGAQVLRDEEDFYRLTRAYLEKAALQNIRHTEIFFDPQTHTLRGIEFKAVVRGIYRAMMDAREHLDLSSKLILCFLRHLSAAQAMETLEQALPYKDWIVAVGLDSSEQDHPPEKFIPVFNAAREAGFKAVAHAGEEGPPDYIWQALNLLKVKRIDHGVRCQEDPGLVDYLAEKQVPLTVCPLSNVRLKVFDHMRHHNLKQLLSSGLCVTINSDDPAYFGGYVQENFMAVHKALGLSPQEIAQLARNSFLASFLDSAEKKVHLNKIEEYLSLNVA
ncbi:MAG: adenosine deaminase [Deltaproteobacteria bacterium]|nr:adenosine deaminase [Deltaproteobacteria bacterium]